MWNNLSVSVCEKRHASKRPLAMRTPTPPRPFVERARQWCRRGYAPTTGPASPGRLSLSSNQFAHAANLFEWLEWDGSQLKRFSIKLARLEDQREPDLQIRLLCLAPWTKQFSNYALFSICLSVSQAVQRVCPRMRSACTHGEGPELSV